MSDAGGTATRRTATFLFTDIVGSTERWEHDAVDMRVALDRHDRLLRASIETCGGEVFKSVGDALHAVFPTATAAVDAAVDGLAFIVDRGLERRTDRGAHGRLHR